MELYTSLTRAKQILLGTRGNRLPAPAMMPVPEEVVDRIDPAFTIGYGALRECGSVDGFPCPECEGECADRGLQCPVRGCGQFYHHLGKHLASAHADVGGANGVKRLLGIPPSAPLATKELRDESSRKAKERVGSLRGRGNYQQIRKVRTPDVASKAFATTREVKRMVGWRNLTNSCDAQIAQRMHQIVDRIGRSPSCREADLIDPGLTHAAKRLYGTWDNAKTQLGIELRERGRPPVKPLDAVLSALREWYLAWGELPSSRDAQSPERVPLIPARATILRALETESWEDAMNKAADLLCVPRSSYHVRSREGGRWRRETTNADGLTSRELREEMMASIARRRGLSDAA